MKIKIVKLYEWHNEFSFKGYKVGDELTLKDFHSLSYSYFKEGDEESIVKTFKLIGVLEIVKPYTKED